MLRLGICTQCLEDAEGFTALCEAITDAELPVRCEALRCGASCSAPAQIWLQAPGQAAYVFEGIDLNADRQDILTACRAYLESPGGWIEDARPCGRLRFCLTIRMPG